MSRPLEGRVALVAGATRGAGRGIATALGEAGATVWCSGRSVRGAPATPGRPETLEGTVERVEAAGGKGIAVRTDHTVRAEVEVLAGRIREESGRLDVLVNDIWGCEALIDWGRPFWGMDAGAVDEVLRRALATHLLTSRYAVPLMLEGAAGDGPRLVVEITDGDTYVYRGHLLYDLVKTAVIRLAFGQAVELRGKGVAAVALTPGFLRSEAMLDHFGVTEETWRDAARKDPHFLHSETPLFVGRAVAALAADPDVLERSGRAFASWTLAREYGFEDADGRRPDWGAHVDEAFVPGSFPELDDAFYAYWAAGPPEERPAS